MSRTPSKSPGKDEGVQYLAQFPKMFLTPYGNVQQFNNDVFQKRLKPKNCEWYGRPKVAASEMADTFKQCEKVVEESPLIDNKNMKKFWQKTKMFQETLKKFNTKDPNQSVTEKDVKIIVKEMNNEDNKSLFKEMFSVGHALMSMGIHFSVGSYIVGDIKEYASMCKDYQNNSKDLKEDASQRNLIKFWRQQMVSAGSKKEDIPESNARRSILSILDDDEDEHQEEEQPKRKKKKY